MAQIRRETDSGLRAGFIREDDVKRVAKPQKDQESLSSLEEKSSETATDNLESDVKSKQEKEVKSPPKNKIPEFKKPEGPKVSMQGISGREITGVVKVVKKVPATPSKDQSQTVADSKQTSDTKVTVQAERKAAKTPSKTKSDVLPTVPKQTKPVAITESPKSAPVESVTATKVKAKSMSPEVKEKEEIEKTPEVKEKEEIEKTTVTKSVSTEQVSAQIDSVGADQKPTKVSTESATTELIKTSDSNLVKQKAKKEIAKKPIKKEIRIA